MLPNNELYPTNLGQAKPKIPGQIDGSQPELCGLLIPIHMHVWRLIRFVAVKIESIWPGS